MSVGTCVPILIYCGCELLMLCNKHDFPGVCIFEVSAIKQDKGCSSWKNKYWLQLLLLVNIFIRDFETTIFCVGFRMQGH